MRQSIALAFMFVVETCASASADTYRFPHDRGHPVKTEHSSGCGSPEITKWLTAFVERDMKVRVVPDKEMIVITPTKDGGMYESRAATTISTVGEWVHTRDNGAKISVLVNVSPYGGLADKPNGSLVPAVRVSVSQRFGKSECHEAWEGSGEKL